jgi:hypothetical protein
MARVGNWSLPFTTWISAISTHNQIIQAVAVDITCVGDWEATLVALLMVRQRVISQPLKTTQNIDL